MYASFRLGSNAVSTRAANVLGLAQVHRDVRLRDALISLDASRCKLVVVTDDAAGVIGLMTDGDIRRAFLRGATLEDAVTTIMQTDFTSVHPSATRADVLDTMRATRIAEVPVLDDARRLVGLHTLHDLVAHNERPNAALVMAGGRGSRLLPITNSIPKPMVRVAGRPILERIVLHLVGAGVREIFISTHHLGQLIEEHFEDGTRFGCRIEYVHEDAPLGTAGALGLLPRLPTEPLVMMNGDLITQADIGALLDFHRRSGNASTIAFRRYLHTVPFGCIELDGPRVVGLEEKPTLQKIVNAGIYVIEPSVIASLQRGVGLDMPELLNRLIKEGHPVGAWEVSDDWIDVGHHDQLERARSGG